MTDSSMTRSLIGALFIFCLSYGDDAYAQYRNNSLTLDAGAGFTFTEGSLTEENTVQARILGHRVNDFVHHIILILTQWLLMWVLQADPERFQVVDGILDAIGK